MRYIDKIILFVFSCVILVISVFALIATLTSGGVNLLTENWFIEKIQNPLTNQETTIVILLEMLMIILALKVILLSEKKSEIKDGILLENNSGKLLISKSTLENLARDVTQGISGVESSSVKIILDKTNKLEVNVEVIISKNISVQETTKKIQAKIVNVIKKSADLEVEKVNVSVRNISTNEVEIEEKIEDIKEEKGK